MRDYEKGGALTETTFYILLALFHPNHGYGVMQFVEKETGGRVCLGAGTLYGALRTLEQKGWISQNGGDGRKKEYVITQAGREICRGELFRLRQLLETAQRIMEADV